MNSNGSLHDVWLLYRCIACGANERRRLHRRVRESSAFSLEAYRRNDAGAATLSAFSFPRTGPLAHRVVRPPVVGPGLLAIEIRQPVPCRLRWDALLAHELGESRTRIQRAWQGAGVPVPPWPRARALVHDRDRVVLCLDEKGGLASGRG